MVSLPVESKGQDDNGFNSPALSEMKACWKKTCIFGVVIKQYHERVVQHTELSGVYRVISQCNTNLKTIYLIT